MSEFAGHALVTVPPRPSNRAACRTGIERWVEAAERDDGPAAARVRAALDDPTLRPLCEAVFGNSPFVAELMIADPLFALDALRTPPEIVMNGVVGGLVEAERSGADIRPALRRARRKAALVIALADLAERLDTSAIARLLSNFADVAIAAAARHLLRRMAANTTIELPDANDPERGSGLIVLALGKLGARELNYSSDVDLIVFYDPEAVRFCEYEHLQRDFIRLARDLVNILAERTEDGYVFRTDLRLRPDPGATPVALSVLAAETYYESLGQNWERAAMIRVRQVAGDRAAGKLFLDRLRPFVWRKNLDFATIQDIHSIKRQINAHYGGAAIAIPGHNIKLGRGGIREVEFFAQTQQLIWGGRMPALRISGTTEALAALATAELIAPTVANDLAQSYWFLRRLEHRLQMVADQQTHSLPETDQGLEEIAVFLGYETRAAFEGELLFHLRRVEGYYARLFEEAPALTAAEAGHGNLIFTGAEDDPSTIETLSQLGFANPSAVAGVVRSWHHGRYRAMRSARARELLTELIPALLSAFGRTPDPDGAFLRFDEFLSRLPSGIQLFSMFRANPNLLALIAEVMGGAPRLAEHLGRNASALDAVLSPDFYDPPPPANVLRHELAGTLDMASSYEDMLDRCRRWANDRKLQVGVQALQGLIDWTQAGAAFSDVAAVALAAVQQRVIAEFVRQHGWIGGGAWTVIALGKLGGHEMTPTSDLDLIFVYDYDELVQRSDGRSPLEPRRYFARLSQRTINAITAQTSEGNLYEVDMRLRPSGNAGPIASHIVGFEKYHEEQAWTWEHMALTRARVIAGDGALGRRVEQVIRAALIQPRDPDKLRVEVADMRARIEREFRAKSRWEVKYLRGGLVDIDFIAQYLQLRHAHAHPEVLHRATGDALTALSGIGALAAEDANVLQSALRLWQAVQGLLRLAITGRFEPEDDAAVPEALRGALLRATGEPDFLRLTLRMDETARAVHMIYQRIIETGEN